MTDASLSPVRHWTAAEIPHQGGRRVVVTGSNSGLGFQTAAALAGAGADVVLAVRDPDRGERAAATIRERHREATVRVAPLDLADLASVRAFTATWHSTGEPLGLLVNNAGIMALPFGLTTDGFEQQVGVNHLGHFALTAGLLPALSAEPGSRVVTVSSAAHAMGRLHRGEAAELAGSDRQHYSRWGRYGVSKLANLLFMGELARRAQWAGLDLISVAAHPGYSATDLQLRGARQSTSPLAGVQVAVTSALNAVLGQPAAMGALPTLYAATAAGVMTGEYFGPDGPMQARGYPRRVGMSASARDAELAARVWQASEELTGVSFGLPASAVERRPQP